MIESVFLDANFMKYLEDNRSNFENDLLQEAVTVKDKISDIMKIGNIDLINNANKLVKFVINRQHQELRDFANQEGIAWATHSIPLTFKLEWVQAIRRTLWTYIEKYNLIKNMSIDSFFELEKQINNGIDQFLNAFFIKYSTYKDQLITAQRELVENLSVPIIPITSTICILPLIGSIDSSRSRVIETKVLNEISRLHIQTLIMDLSGIADMETEVIDQIMVIIKGTSMMGCKTIITGLRADVVRKMIDLGVSFDSNTQTLGTLQQALSKYFVTQQ